ncbi:hypothetical protein EDD85DRAFT_794985 [Armillaria nabsnona]|nr:hypothetical protein EDD85DRAFT_794985 [Armillaria nabsnona]
MPRQPVTPSTKRVYRLAMRSKMDLNHDPGCRTDLLQLSSSAKLMASYTRAAMRSQTFRGSMGQTHLLKKQHAHRTLTPCLDYFDGEFTPFQEYELLTKEPNVLKNGMIEVDAQRLERPRELHFRQLVCRLEPTLKHQPTAAAPFNRTRFHYLKPDALSLRLWNNTRLNSNKKHRSTVEGFNFNRQCFEFRTVLLPTPPPQHSHPHRPTIPYLLRFDGGTSNFAHTSGNATHE